MQAMNDPSDLTSQIRVMADIYGGMYITISAATAEASAEGFLEDRVRDKEMMFLYKLRLIDMDRLRVFRAYQNTCRDVARTVEREKEAFSGVTVGTLYF